MSPLRQYRSDARVELLYCKQKYINNLKFVSGHVSVCLIHISDFQKVTLKFPNQ
jgi:hypothetical protein